MTIQLSVAVRNDRLDALETSVGTAPFLDIRTGAQPASCADADSGTEIEHMALPSNWMSTATSGTKSKAGTWEGQADASGTAGHFRIKDTTDTTCHVQGSITAVGGGGDMEVDNIDIITGQAIVVNTFVLTDGNA